MAEVASNTPRLMAAAKEFNIGKETLVEFLTLKGFNEEDLKPTAKLSVEMYRTLQAEFQGDKAAKQKASAVDLPKGAGADSKRKRNEEDISIKKKEAAAATKEAEKPKEEAPVVAAVEPVVTP